MKHADKIKSWVILGVLVSFIVPIGYLVFMIITTPDAAGIDREIRARSDYILMLTQCILGIAALLLPPILSKKISLQIPSNMYLVYVLFLWCAIFLGEVRDFYYLIPHWDTILHAFSGGMLGALGFSVVDLLNKNHVMSTRLSPSFVALFAFTFALSLGTLWEIYEFSGDSLLGLNMQKYRLADGADLVGQAALADTMKDLIVDAISAGAICIIGYFSLKNKTGFIDKVKIKFKKIPSKLAKK